MKTYVKKTPLPEGTIVNKDFVSLVLSEEETYWIYAEDCTCHPYMHNLIVKKVEKTEKRHKLEVRVFDSNGKRVKPQKKEYK